MKLTRVVAIALLLGAQPTPAAAQSSMPVYVSVVGSGQIRVVLASGGTLPCDATSNVVFFNGKLAAGSVYTFVSPTPALCERHTYGSFREAQWSPDRLWALQRSITGVPRPWRLDITLSTNGY